MTVFDVADGGSALTLVGVGAAHGLNLSNQSADNIEGGLKDFRRARSAKTESAIERYQKNGCYLDLCIGADGHGRIAKLASGASPFGHGVVDSEAAVDAAKSEALTVYGGWREYAVRIPVPDLVHGPQGAISSLIWSAGYDDLQNLCVKVVASAMEDFSFSLCGSSAERVLAPLGVGLSGGHPRAGVERVVEGVSEVPKDTFCQHGEPGRYAGLEADLELVLSGLRVELYNSGPIVSVNELGGKFIKSADVFLRLFQVETGASEGLFHE